MPKSIIYLLIGLFSICFRAYLNYSSSMIPGVNGGYYPLQVRELIETGVLSFADLPLFFYFNALILKGLSFLGISVTDIFIINFMKAIDSIFLPLLLISVYYFIKKIQSNLSLFQEIILLTYLTLSFSPLILTSDMQKNAAGIPFLFAFILFFYQYIDNKRKINLYFTIIFMFLTGLTHFGVFVFTLLIFLFGIIFTEGKKAIPWIIILLGVSFLLLYLMDPFRAGRLLHFWNVLFAQPALFKGPLPFHDIVNIVLSYFIVLYSLFILKMSANDLSKSKTILIKILCLMLIIFTFPLIDFEYFRRFTLFLFIPQTLLLFIILPKFPKTIKTVLVTFLGTIIIISVIVNTINNKQPIITEKSIQELLLLNKECKVSDDNTIIIARHGLEWWIAYYLKAKVGQEKAFNEALSKSYKRILFIHQKKGYIEQYGSVFPEPIIPMGCKIIYSSDYFDLFQLER